MIYHFCQTISGDDLNYHLDSKSTDLGDILKERRVIPLFLLAYF